MQDGRLALTGQTEAEYLGISPHLPTLHPDIFCVADDLWMNKCLTTKVGDDCQLSVSGAAGEGMGSELSIPSFSLERNSFKSSWN